MKLFVVLSIILLFILISIVIYTKFLKSKNTDCLVSDWTDYSNCSNDCGGGIKTRTRTIIKNPGSGCPLLTETESCNTESCKTLQFSYEGTITADRTYEGSTEFVKSENIGISPVDFFAKNVNIQTTESKDQGFGSFCSTGAFVILRDGIEKRKAYFVIPRPASSTNLVKFSIFSPPFEIKKGDIIRIDAIVLQQGCLTSITNIILTFNSSDDCIVGDFVDQSGCLDPQGNPVDCGGKKIQVRPIFQYPQGGGTSCPQITRLIDCVPPCPILSYKYDGQIYAEGTGENVKGEDIGIINTDFLIYSIKISSSYESSDQQSGTTCSYINISILRDNEEIYGSLTKIPSEDPSINITLLLTPFVQLNRGDIIRINAIAVGELCYTLITNPIVTFFEAASV